jgi:hypothetical protein
MHLSTVETVLEYQVQSPTHFCFNIEAAHWPTQKILSEKARDLVRRVAARLYRRAQRQPLPALRRQPGPLLVNYKAEVEVHTLAPDTSCASGRWARCPTRSFPTCWRRAIANPTCCAARW